MAKKEKIIVVLPAYNAARTLKKVYQGINRRIIDKVILVDDGSKDGTGDFSKKLGIDTIIHRRNKGYGANQKTCYKQALKLKADYVIMLHPDGQYDPKDLKKFVAVLKSRRVDMVLGSRFLESGDKETPVYKSLALKIIATLFNLVLGTKLTEANTGYRGYSRKLLTTIPFYKNGDGYLFDPQMIIQAVHFGFNLAEVPVSKRYNPERIEPKFIQSIHHGLENLSLLLQYLLHKKRIRPADFLIK
jgi:glycosyltransferase involved in cell wall biosynthesis